MADPIFTLLEPDDVVWADVGSPVWVDGVGTCTVVELDGLGGAWVEAGYGWDDAETLAGRRSYLCRGSMSRLPGTPATFHGEPARGWETLRIVAETPRGEPLL